MRARLQDESGDDGVRVYYEVFSAARCRYCSCGPARPLLTGPR